MCARTVGVFCATNAAGSAKYAASSSAGSPNPLAVARARSSAAAIAAEAVRCSGSVCISFSIARDRSGPTPGFLFAGATSDPLAICASTFAGEPAYGSDPVASWYSVAPSE